MLPWIFAAIMAAGLTFLLISIFFGGLGDADFADMGLDIGSDVGDGTDFGCIVIAAFLAGFGSFGLLGTLAEWHVFFTILSALAFGLIFGRTTMAMFRFVLRQEHNELMTSNDLIGKRARVTVNVPPGKVGEALVEADSVMKYPIRHVDEAVELHKGDYVQVIDVVGGRLLVKNI